ncbi:MAG TPA: extracellular solute-binding protein, partial [Chloroflexota bacterium]
MGNSESSRKGISRRTFLKDAILGAVGISGLAALAGCQSQPPAAGAGAPAAGATAATGGAPAQVKPAAKGNVKYLTWWWAETGRNEAWRSLVKEFQAQNPDITIEEVSIPFAQFQDTVATQFATGAVNADLMSAADTFFLKLQATNLLFSLDKVVDYEQYKSKLEPENVSGVKDGQRYGFSIAPVPHALIYNKRLYDEAGITKPPTTPDEYIAVGEKIRKAPDTYGFAARNTIPEATGWYIDLCNYVYGFGGRWSSQDGKPTLDSKEVIAAMTYFKRLYDSPAFPKGATAGDYRKMAWQGKLGEYI